MREEKGGKSSYKDTTYLSMDVGSPARVLLVSSRTIAYLGTGVEWAFLNAIITEAIGGSPPGHMAVIIDKAPNFSSNFRDVTWYTACDRWAKLASLVEKNTINST